MTTEKLQTIKNAIGALAGMLMIPAGFLTYGTPISFIGLWWEDKDTYICIYFVKIAIVLWILIGLLKVADCILNQITPE